MTKLSAANLEKMRPAFEEMARPCSVAFDETDFGFRIGVCVEWPNEASRSALMFKRQSGGGYVRESLWKRVARVIRREPRPTAPVKENDLESVLADICVFLVRQGQAARAYAYLDERSEQTQT